MEKWRGGREKERRGKGKREKSEMLEVMKGENERRGRGREKEFTYRGTPLPRMALTSPLYRISFAEKEIWSPFAVTRSPSLEKSPVLTQLRHNLYAKLLEKNRTGLIRKTIEIQNALRKNWNTTHTCMHAIKIVIIFQFVRVDLRPVCTTNSMKQRNCYSGTEACLIDSQPDKNGDNKNYNEPVVIAHKFRIKKEKSKLPLDLRFEMYIGDAM